MQIAYLPEVPQEARGTEIVTMGDRVASHQWKYILHGNIVMGGIGHPNLAKVGLGSDALLISVGEA